MTFSSPLKTALFSQCFFLLPPPSVSSRCLSWPTLDSIYLQAYPVRLMLSTILSSLHCGDQNGLLEIWCLLGLMIRRIQCFGETPDDSAFLQSLQCSCGVYPPLTLIEAFIAEENSAPRVRKLHLDCRGLEQTLAACCQSKTTTLYNSSRQMQTNVGTLFPSLGTKIKKLTSSDMSLDMQWRTVTFRAIFFGLYEQRNNLPVFGCLER